MSDSTRLRNALDTIARLTAERDAAVARADAAEAAIADAETLRLEMERARAAAQRLCRGGGCKKR